GRRWWIARGRSRATWGLRRKQQRVGPRTAGRQWRIVCAYRAPLRIDRSIHPVFESQFRYLFVVAAVGRQEQGIVGDGDRGNFAIRFRNMNTAELVEQIDGGIAQ